MLLREVLYKVSIRSVAGDTGMELFDITADSRQVKKGSAFVAIKGTQIDGHQFIDKAIDSGATVIVCETIPDNQQDGITYIEVEKASLALAIMSANLYGQPSEKLKVVGVTGTNGKTTIATLLFKLFSALGYKSGLLSTVENKIGDQVLSASHTTPDAVQLQQLLQQMLQAGCTHVFMEVSSHALHQHRVSGVQFVGAIFSNITHDHLDYHKTFDEYIRVKKSFFDQLSSHAFAISNADDKRGIVMLQNTQASKFLYSLKTMAAYKGKIIENNLSGLIMSVNGQEVHFRMAGEFNAYNLLAVYGAAICLSEDPQEVLRHLSVQTGAEGRFDCVVSPKDKVLAIIDYAHTPDALLNMLVTINKLKKGTEQVITVVGCGGDRDKTKRPVMAAAACEHSDKAIFTSDNPRSEEPEQIIKDMEEGLPASAKRKYLVVPDRKEAIKAAIAMAQSGDIVLVAGKGHEKYQEIKGVKHHFDDKEVIIGFFELLER